MKVRLPPQDMGAERRVIGCLLLDNTKIAWAHTALDPARFYGCDNRRFYEIILKQSGGPVDMITVSCEARESGMKDIAAQLNKMVDMAHPFGWNYGLLVTRAFVRG